MDRGYRVLRISHSVPLDEYEDVLRYTTASTDAHIITGTGCPDINLTWQLSDGSAGTDVWEIHGRYTFNKAFGEENTPVAQMDTDTLNGEYPAHPAILFSTTKPTAQVRIVGFRIGEATDRTTLANAWIINIYKISDDIVKLIVFPKPCLWQEHY